MATARSAPGSAVPEAGAERARVRMSHSDRRRQLVGIGLRKFAEQPVQDLSLDAVAAEAGVSRGLLFHYFPTKTDFYRAVVEAAGRRVLRNVAPDPGLSGEPAVDQIVDRFVAQIARRRGSYVALVQGQGPFAVADAVAGAGRDGASARTAATLREQLAALVLSATGLPGTARPAVHGWVAYVEDRALQAGDPVPAGLVPHCVAALHALTTL